MKEHGNLYWEIDFDIAPYADASYCDRDSINVRDYDYATAFKKAQAIYKGTCTGETVITLVALYLRMDDSDSHRFDILKKWMCNNPVEFFGATPETAMHAMKCVG